MNYNTYEIRSSYLIYRHHRLPLFMHRLPFLWNLFYEHIVTVFKRSTNPTPLGRTLSLVPSVCPDQKENRFSGIQASPIGPVY